MSNVTARVFGVALAATGAAHFVAPQVFEPLTKVAYPTDTSRWIRRNGATEVALGLGLLSGRTRKLATAGSSGYVVTLATRTMGNKS